MVAEHFWIITSIHFTYILIKQSDMDITEWTEIVRGKQVTARIYLNSEGGQQVTFHSALRT